MHCNWKQITQAVFAALLATSSEIVAQKVLLTNDDGWAVAQIRAQYDSLVQEGYNVRTVRVRRRTYARVDADGLVSGLLEQVVLSAPAENKSGTGSSSAPPAPLQSPCEFDTCPTGSPAEGFNASNRMSVRADLVARILICSP